MNEKITKKLYTLELQGWACLDPGPLLLLLGSFCPGLLHNKFI